MKRHLQLTDLAVLLSVVIDLTNPKKERFWCCCETLLLLIAPPIWWMFLVLEEALKHYLKSFFRDRWF